MSTSQYQYQSQSLLQYQEPAPTTLSQRPIYTHAHHPLHLIHTHHSPVFLHCRGSRPAAAAAAGSSMMGSRLALFGALALLLAVSFGAAEAAPAVVVGSVKCLDCSPDDVSAEDALKGLQVAIKCRSGAGETYETQTVGRLDDNGAFSIPLQAGLLREDGRLDRDCFAQLHSAPGTPCDGPAPPRIAPAKPSTQGVADANTYLAVAEDTVFSPVACACKKKKKNFMVGPPPPPPPRPEPSYGPPTPTPTPTPTPSYGPPSTPKPPAPEDDPKPFFHKHPKMKKMMHKKKPCPPLGEEDKPERKN